MARSPLFWFILCLVGIALLTLASPAEKVLGANARVVYLHGVWVWASLAAFTSAALTGLVGLLLAGCKPRLSDRLQRWSRALGRTGLFFWITYLPISMWAMQTSWNGLYLAEPRFRLAVIFSATGLLLQIGVTLLEDPAWASVANLGYAIALIVALVNTQNVMHPPSPILNTNAVRIQLYFFALFSLALLAAWQVARWWWQLERAAESRSEAIHSARKSDAC